MTSRHRSRGLSVLLIASLAAALLLAASAQASPALTDQVALGFTADGYRYMQTSHGAVAGFEDPSYPDGSWSIGSGAFGSGNCFFNANASTPWDINTDMLLRHAFTLPAGATNVRVLGTVDNVATVYVNGVNLGSIRGDNCNADQINMTAPASAIHSGTNVLALRAFDDGGGTYVDQKVVYDVLADSDD